MAASKISVREIEPGNFVVIDSGGHTLRSGFDNPRVAWMWAGRKGLHKSPKRQQSDVIREVPSELVDEQILRLPLLAKMSDMSVDTFIGIAKSGQIGPIFRLSDRISGLKFGDWKRWRDSRVVSA
jgi:hypothetical protein